MKFFVFGIMFLLVQVVNAQRVKNLFEIEKWDSIPKGKAGIYGNFIPREGVMTGGDPQFITIANIDTKEVYRFKIKGSIKEDKQKPFFYELKPGTYAIINYVWSETFGIASVKHTEPIYRGIDASDKFNEKIKSGEIKTEDLSQYQFTVTENSLHYLGNWNFEKGMVSFTDEKQLFDEKAKPMRTKLKFDGAKTELPD